VCITYLVAEGTADEHVASLLLSKLPVLDAVVDLKSTVGVGDALREALGFGDEKATERLMNLICVGETVS
jgi:hypothetical protein